MTSVRWGTLLLLLVTPALQGAGCSAHYSGRVKGQIVADESLRYAHSGHTMVVIYRHRDADSSNCADDWPKCLGDDGWEPLIECDAVTDGGGKTTSAAVSEGQAAQGFDACTGMVGVEYEADVAAFIDLDDDGAPSSGDPYGVYIDGPLTHASEGQRISIRISESMP
jgi:hypothetical protein